MLYRESVVHGRMGFPIALYRLDRNHIRYFMNFHWHPECELIYIREGTMELRLNQTLYYGTAGDLFFLPGGTFHAGIPHHCVYDCLVFHLPLLMKSEDTGRKMAEAVASGEIQPKNPLPKNSKLHNIMKTIVQSMESRKPGYTFTVEGLILQWIGEYLTNQEQYTLATEQIYRSVTQDEKLRNVLDYFERNYAQPIALSDMASVAGLTPNYFCRYFKQITNQTPVEYLNQLRIDAAAHRLVTTEQSVLEIALGCGFNDASHFIRQFKRIKKETPSKYRRTVKESVAHIVGEK